LIFAALSFALLLCGAVYSFAQERDRDQDGFVTIFNGKDLTDWEGNPAIWSVEDSILVGQSPEGKPYDKQDYIYWTKAEPGDFILRLIDDEFFEAEEFFRAYYF